MDAWQLLGIEPTDDLRAIKRAYSVQLKSTRPDDDAQAYQALREAYDWAQQYARWLAQQRAEGGVKEEEFFVADTGASAQIETIDATQTASTDAHTAAGPTGSELHAGAGHLAPGAEDVPSSASSATIESSAEAVPQVFTPEQLVQGCTEWMTARGTDTLHEAWPALQRALDDLPIVWRGQASREFAQFVMRHAQLPQAFLLALTHYFQWGLDFRADQQLGSALAHAIQARLEANHVHTAIHLKSQERYGWVKVLASLAERGQLWRARLLMLLLNFANRTLILETPSNVLGALGLSGERGQFLRSTADFAGWIQATLCWALVIAVMLLDALHSDRGGGLGGHDLQRVIAVRLLVLAFVTPVVVMLYVRFYAFVDEVMQVFAIENIRVKVWRYLERYEWWAYLALFVGIVLIVGLASPWTQQGTNQIPVYWELGAALLSILCGLIWFLAPMKQVSWRALVLPVFSVAWWGLETCLSTIPGAVAFCLAFVWTMASHAYLLKFPETVEMFYRQVACLGVVRYIEMPVFLFPLAVPVYALLMLVGLPMLLFRMAAQYRPDYSLFVLVAALFLAHLSEPESVIVGVPLVAIGGVLFVPLLQSVLQRWADRLARRWVRV